MVYKCKLCGLGADLEECAWASGGGCEQVTILFINLTPSMPRPKPKGL